MLQKEYDIRKESLYISALVSIHAHREGCDEMAYGRGDNYRVFQSTHPRGVRLSAGRSYQVSGSGFNPRTREGCDDKDIQFV